MDAKPSLLREHWQLLCKRRKIVLAVFACVLSLVLAGILVATPVYEGTAQIILERVEPDRLSGGSRAPVRDLEFNKTQFQLIRSHAVAKRVVEILELESSYETTYHPDGQPWLKQVRSWSSGLLSAVTDLWRDADSDENEEINSQLDQIAKEISKDLRVRPVEGSHITAISYSSPNPELAAAVANTYIKAYLQETLEMKMDATRRNLEWMTQKAEAERLKLQTVEAQLQEYVESSNLVALEGRVAVIPEKLSQLGRDLVRAETKTKEHKLLYDRVMRASGNLDAAETVLSISEDSTLNVLRAQILKAEQSVIELSNKYGSKHPVMLKAVRDLEVLRNKRAQEIGRITQKVRDQYELARSNERSIRSQLNKTKAEAIELNEKYVQYTAMKGEIETNRQLYDALLMKIKDQSITGETRPVNVWVVESARVPLKPVSPKTGLNLGLGVILGLVCGVAGAFLADHLDNRIKSIEGAEKALGLPVLGSVSYNRDADRMFQIVNSAPRSEYSESFNTLRTSLMLTVSGSSPRRILVTSSIAGEGKTTTAVNLAMTMAKAGSKVLLIDADLRKPRIHKIFNLPNKAGLSNYLTGTVNRSILHKSPLDNLAIVPAGPIPHNPYGLLNSRQMASLLDKLADEFDIIICDTAPVLSVSDSRLLCQNFDGVLMVIKSGLTTYPMVQASIRALQNVNARILGLFVNAIQVVDQEEYFRYYSSYFQETGKPETSESGVPLATLTSQK